MAQFDGQLNVNAIQSAIFNMIISQDILGGKIKNNYNLVDKAKDEAGLYGDTKLYYDSPNLTPVTWKQDDDEFINVLKLHRPGAPKVQKLTIDVFKQVAVTKDNYLSKQAFANEGAFTAYIGVLESRLSKAKEVYLNKTYNTFIGTAEGGATIHEYEINTAANNNSTGENIAYKMANLIDDMKDYSTDYTKNGFERAFGEEDIEIVWNNKYVNAVKKIDLPSVFHDEALQSTFVGDVLPARYFGDVDTEATTADGALRAVADLYFRPNGSKITALNPLQANEKPVYVAAGDIIPKDYTFEAGDAYEVNDKIICKVFTKLPPVLEAFSVGTDFFNARNLSTNMYLTFGHSTLELLDSEACVTVVDTAE